MLELCVAAGLMMNKEFRSFQRAGDLTRFQSRQEADSH
jgi:hypothetical protein